MLPDSDSLKVSPVTDCWTLSQRRMVKSFAAVETYNLISHVQGTKMQDILIFLWETKYIILSI